MPSSLLYIKYFNSYSDLWKIYYKRTQCIAIEEKPIANEGNSVTKLNANVLQLEYFYNEIYTCPNYRALAIHNLQRQRETLIIILDPNFKYNIDYKWCAMLCLTILESIELEYAMSWLSTLGGAFSAYGENSNFHANVAGKISLYQLKLALRIGDPLTVARCKLYFSLALIQKGYLRKAKYVIKEQFKIARQEKEIDSRLIKMCYGIWSKLKYAQFLRKKNKQIRAL